MGSGGMVAAEFAATLGLRVAVIERARVGGDCLWTGCVPSKTLLASAKAAHAMRTADRLGLPAADPDIDTARVFARVRAVQQQVATTDDDPARFEAMGVEVIRGAASLVGPHTVRVTSGDATAADLETRFVLLCTGSRPAVPAISGLEEAGYLTSETVFELERAPASVVTIGGGPVAVELAQAFRRLGVPTTVLQRGPRVLPRDEPELVAALSRRLADEGVEMAVDVRIDRVTFSPNNKTVHAGDRHWSAEEILVAAGRRANVEGLGLEGLGIPVGPSGVVVDGRMRTPVPSVYAAGDVAGRFRFTHSAGYEAVRAVRDMFFPGKGKVGDLVPWCTFTDPELAHAGLTIAEAERHHGSGAVGVWRMDLSHSDRARAEGHAEGAVVIVTAKGKVVGAHVLSANAGEVIHELALAIHQELKLSEVASLVHVYPTLATSVGQLAAEAAYDGARRLRWLVRKAR